MAKKIKISLPTSKVSPFEVVLMALDAIDTKPFSPELAERWKNATRKAGKVFTSNDIIMMSAMHDKLQEYSTTEHTCECEAGLHNNPCYHRAYLLLQLRYAKLNS